MEAAKQQPLDAVQLQLLQLQQGLAGGLPLDPYPCRPPARDGPCSQRTELPLSGLGSADKGPGTPQHGEGLTRSLGLAAHGSGDGLHGSGSDVSGASPLCTGPAPAQPQPQPLRVQSNSAAKQVGDEAHLANIDVAQLLQSVLAARQGGEVLAKPHTLLATGAHASGGARLLGKRRGSLDAGDSPEADRSSKALRHGSEGSLDVALPTLTSLQLLPQHDGPQLPQLIRMGIDVGEPRTASGGGGLGVAGGPADQLKQLAPSNGPLLQLVPADLANPATLAGLTPVSVQQLAALLSGQVVQAAAGIEQPVAEGLVARTGGGAGGACLGGLQLEGALWSDTPAARDPRAMPPPPPPSLVLPQQPQPKRPLLPQALPQLSQLQPRLVAATGGAAGAGLHQLLSVAEAQGAVGQPTGIDAIVAAAELLSSCHPPPPLRTGSTPTMPGLPLQGAAGQGPRLVLPLPQPLPRGPLASNSPARRAAAPADRAAPPALAPVGTIDLPQGGSDVISAATVTGAAALAAGATAANLALPLMLSFPVLPGLEPILVEVTGVDMDAGSGTQRRPQQQEPQAHVVTMRMTLTSALVAALRAVQAQG